MESSAANVHSTSQFHCEGILLVLEFISRKIDVVGAEESVMLFDIYEKLEFIGPSDHQLLYVHVVVFNIHPQFHLYHGLCCFITNSHLSSADMAL